MGELFAKLLGLLESQQAKDAGITAVEDIDDEELYSVTLTYNEESFLITVEEN